jgi:hypothetical protein
MDVTIVVLPGLRYCDLCEKGELESIIIEFEDEDSGDIAEYVLCFNCAAGLASDIDMAIIEEIGA